MDYLSRLKFLIKGHKDNNNLLQNNNSYTKNNIRKY